MKNALDVLRRLLHPPQWVVFTLPPIAFAALTHVLLEGMDGVPAYIIYCMSAYCLVICILPLPICPMVRHIPAPRTREELMTKM